MKSIGAACAALILLACGQSPVNAEDVTVKATDGGIAIGGNVTNSTIGVSDETLKGIVEALEKGNEAHARAKTIAVLEEKLDLNENQIRAALDTSRREGHPAGAARGEARRDCPEVQGPGIDRGGTAGRRRRGHRPEEPSRGGNQGRGAWSRG